jgi:hypothetical protein
MWTYIQSTGDMLDGNGNVLATGYSGKGPDKNNPAMESVRGLGPIPVGIYNMELPPVDTETHGPCVIWLTPDPSNDMLGRSGFGIHGDSFTHMGQASEGCIILPRFARERMAEIGGQVQVVSGLT